MKPVLQSTKKVMKLKLKWKRKRLMIGCVNHRKSQVMIVKRPQTKGKACCIGISNKTFYTHPTPIQSPTIKEEFKYNDYMRLASQSLLTFICVYQWIKVEFKYSD